MLLGVDVEEVAGMEGQRPGEPLQIVLKNHAEVAGQ